MREDKSKYNKFRVKKNKKKKENELRLGIKELNDN